MLQGVVTDEERQPVADARVQVLGYSAQTGADGSFLIEVPLSQQATSYRLTVMKAGFEIWDYNGGSSVAYRADAHSLAQKIV